MRFSKPDDAVITNLNPSEDYKTSILGGLSPNVIMECAGRALSFWAYQTTQEIYYQQYLYKTLTKYSSLSDRLDQTFSDANSEIERLQNKLNGATAELDATRRKNEELAQAFREKSRKLLQTQELYDKVKRKAEMGHIQKAALDAVDSTISMAPQPQMTGREYDMDSARGGPDMQVRGSSSSHFALGGRMEKPGRSHIMSQFSPQNVVASGNRWFEPGEGLSSHAGGLYVPVGPDAREKPRTSFGSTFGVRGFSNTPTAQSVGSGRSPGNQNPGFSQNRGALSGIGLSSGLKVSQPTPPTALGAGVRNHGKF